MRVLYIADDGKEFDNEFDCEHHEWMLNHPNLKYIKIYDNRTGELFDDIMTDDAYNYGDKVMIPTEFALKDLHDWATYSGYCYFHQITEAGTWVFNEDENTYEKVGDQLGLDFGIQKRRKGEAYDNLRWEDAHDSWRNCHEVKRIFKETIEFDDTYCYPISIGAMQILIKKLSDELQKVDFNKMEEVDDYSVNKLLCAIEDLTKIVNDAIWDYSQGIEYEYRVFDSFQKKGRLNECIVHT